MFSLWAESVWDHCLLGIGREYYPSSEFLAQVYTEEPVANCVKGSIHNAALERREMWRTYSHGNEESLLFHGTERPSLNWLRNTQRSHDFLSGHLSEVQWISSELVMYPCACSTNRGARSSSSADGSEMYTRWCLHNAGSKRVSVSRCVSDSMLHLLLKYFLWWALCSIKWSPVLNKKVSCVMQKKRVIFYATDQCNKEIKLVIFISIDVFAHASVYTQSKFLKTETCYRETFFMLPLLKPYTCTELRWKEGLSTLCWYSTKYHSVFNWCLKLSMNYHEFLKRRKKKEIQGFGSHL